MKKLIALLLSMLLMVAVFAPSVAEEQIVIKLSCAASEQEKISCEQTVARFEEKYPNVKVEAEYYAGLSWDEIIQKQLVEFAAGTQADVVYIAIEGTHLMVEYDLFQPITDLIEANKDYFAEVPQSAFDAFKVGDEYYEVPFNCNDMAIAYNTEMFDAIGRAGGLRRNTSRLWARSMRSTIPQKPRSQRRSGVPSSPRLRICGWLRSAPACSTRIGPPPT